MKKFILVISLVLVPNVNAGWFDKIKEFGGYLRDRVVQTFVGAKNVITEKFIKPVDEQIVQKIVSEVNQQSKQVLEKYKSSAKVLRDVILKLNRHSKQVASIRTGGPISENEKTFLKNREGYVKKALEKLDIKNGYVPKIAICGSGGGTRSTISFLGFLLGVEKNNILNTVTYISSLSGSSWTVAPWIVKGQPLTEYSQYMKERVAKGMGPIAKGEQIQKFIRALLTKFLFLQPITPVDIFSGLVANYLLQNFDPERHNVHLSAIAPKVTTGTIPMPIFSSILVSAQPYRWVEFNPFEVGSTYLGAFVPTWAFGREFSNGRSTDFAPEQSLGYLLGIWGSAFETNLKDLIRIEEEAIKKESKILYEIINTLQKTDVGNLRLWPATVYNFAYTINSSPLSNKKNISLMDAGIDFNLALPPLLQRDLDLIIIFDASSDKLWFQLENAVAYTKSNKHKFPEMNLKNLGDKRIYVFKNSTGPTIIYMPLLNENGEYLNGYDWRKEDYAKTTNFKYTNEQFEKLLGLAKFNTDKSAQVIIDVIKEIASKK